MVLKLILILTDYDWEAEHEKMVNNLEKKIENKDEYLLTTEVKNRVAFIIYAHFLFEYKMF